MIINRNNYEEYFLLYIDRELNRKEQLMVEDFVRLHPDLENEFSLLRQTIAIPPVMIFEGREKLLKEEKRRRIFPIFWMQVAAILMILLAGGWFLLLITGEAKNNNESADPSKQLALHQDRSNPDGNKKEVPESAAKPANPAGSENPQNGNPAAVTNSANGQKEHLIDGTKTRPRKKRNTPVGINLPNSSYVKPDLAENPEKKSPESSEPISPSTELPSTINPPSPASLKTVVEADRFGGQGRQPSTNPYDSQSILVFSNHNKTVTGFFKKLLAKSGDEPVTADNRKRKIKISAFQFNLSK